MRRSRTLAICVVGALALAFAACDSNGDREIIVGSGVIETLSFDFADFDAVSLTTTLRADITASDGFSVVIEADDNLIDLVEVDLRGDTLHIGFEDGFSLRGVTLLATIEMPDARRIDASGEVQVDLFGFTSTIDRRIDLSGASKLEGTLNAKHLRIDVSGASQLLIAGDAAQLDLTVSGASQVEARGFRAARADIDAGGASTVTITITDQADRLEATGASVITYYGEPIAEDVSISGASAVNRR